MLGLRPNRVRVFESIRGQTIPRQTIILLKALKTNLVRPLLFAIRSLVDRRFQIPIRFREQPASDRSYKDAQSRHKSRA